MSSAPKRTKFYRPSLPGDLVDRPRLIDLLNRGLDRPLTVVSAPAGYGKSIMVSAWLNTCERPSAWLSLDESVNDLGVFLTYFVAAIRAVLPGALQETQTLLTAISLPPPGVLTTSLINELDEVERDFIMVLDDYHSIHKQEIHEQLTALLQPPSKHMHVVIITRRDPPLPTSVLLARNQMTEVRVSDLRFSEDETAAFMHNALRARLSDEALAALTLRAEGWITSLRLAALTLRNRLDADSVLVEMQALGHNRNLTEYLISEVLAQAPVEVVDFLLKTSVLHQMCGPLCDALLGQTDPAASSQAHLEWLEQNNFFTTSLDSEGRWYRYHHLLRSFLKSRLEQDHDAREIAELHARASAWFARQGLLEEALQYALLAHDLPAAVSVMAAHRHALMDSEEWQRHERAFAMFPPETVAEHPDLLLMSLWRARLGGKPAAHVLNLLATAERLLEERSNQSTGGEHAAQLRGEIDTMRAIIAWEAAKAPEDVISLAERGLATVPRAWYYVRASAWLYMALAYQMTGKLEQAEAAVAQGEAEDLAQDGSVRARVAATRCFMAWMAGDLTAMSRAANYTLLVSEKHHRHESLMWAHYLLGSVTYQQNDLASAEAHVRIAEEMRYLGRPMAYLQSAFIYASIWQGRGLPDQARQKLDLAFAFLAETGSDGLLPLAEAFRAELAAMQGDLPLAGRWAATAGLHLPLTALPYFYAPQLTLPKILLAQNTPSSRKQAAERLSELEAFVTSTHNTRFTIEVLALQALLFHAEGQLQDALAVLERAVKLAQPGGLLRVFVDLGPTMANLLRRLAPASAVAQYIDQILLAFPTERLSSQPPPAVLPVKQPVMIEALTRRELQVLELLAQRMTSKEIAEKLIVSEETVRRHRVNIYQKLGVHTYREAIAAAAAAGILPAGPR